MEQGRINVTHEFTEPVVGKQICGVSFDGDKISIGDITSLSACSTKTPPREIPVRDIPSAKPIEGKQPQGVFVLLGKTLVDIQGVGVATFDYAKTHFTFTKEQDKIKLRTKADECSTSVNFTPGEEVMVLKYTGFEQKAWKHIDPAIRVKSVAYKDYKPEKMDVSKLDMLTESELHEAYKNQEITISEYCTEMRRRSK